MPLYRYCSPTFKCISVEDASVKYTSISDRVDAILKLLLLPEFRASLTDYDSVM